MNLSRITRDSHDIAFYTEGAGPYLLGLSGFGCNHYNFIDLLPELKKHFTVVLIDNRATGKSGPTTKDYKMSDLAADALAVMDLLKVKKFGLMGISMGGFIAQELVKLAGDRVSALALMCTTSGPPVFDHPKKLTEADLRASAACDPKVYAELMTDFTTHPTLKVNHPDRYQRIINLRLENKMDLEEKIRQNRAAVKFLETPFDLSALKCPLYISAGETDRFVSPQSPAIFKSVLPHAVTELIPETDHYYFLEKPVLVGEKLNNFFQGKA
ncbi:MAG: alpha/beta hydrolase [Bacteriovorax sp.]|nr:alpha/beta hydrolase [Bacteriovorax sp.]